MSKNPNLPSRVSAIVLGVADLSQSVAFYRDTAGLELTGQSESLAFFATGSVTLMLNGNLRRGGAPLAGAGEIVFPVESVTAAHQLLTERGCRFVNAPREVMPGSWATTFTDPDGHWLTLFGPQ